MVSHSSDKVTITILRLDFDPLGVGARTVDSLVLFYPIIFSFGSNASGIIDSVDV